jgi:hypothetical protein
MQLRKTLVMLTALSALSLVMTGCPSDETSSLTCSADTDCIESEICHPTAKVCVKTCTAGADCPSSAKTCAALSTTDSRLVCQCATDTLCNSDGATDLVCSNLDKVCAPKCTSDAACGTGRTCDTATGQCKAGSTGGTCSPACGAGQVCDTSTRTCVNNGAACTGEGQSTCVYGSQFCSSSACTALPAPTCQNYTNLSNKSVLGTTGVITYSARVASAATDTAFCGTTDTKRVKIAVSAYSSTPFPATKDDLSGFFFVLVDGMPKSGTAAVSSSAGNYTVSGTNRERAEIVVSFCRPPDSTTLSTGFYFTSGNFLCFQATYL